jgi:hypothetical protein
MEKSNHKERTYLLFRDIKENMLSGNVDHGVPDIYRQGVSG